MKYLSNVFKLAKRNLSAPKTILRGGLALSNRRRTFARGIEALECRQLLATYVITNTLDTGSGSFRQALLDANTNPGADQIVFNIAGDGVKTIAPQSPLPTITDELLIDGLSQPGYAGKPLIVLHGAAAGAQTTGLSINSPRTSVRGLAVNGFGMDGIYIYGSASTGNVLSNNYIGTDASGQVAVPNGRIGIHIRAGATNVLVGGNRSTGNLISSNGLAGVYIADAGSMNHRLSGNLVGTNSDGNAALGDSIFGLYVGQGASDTFVGTNLDGVDDENEGNVVSGGNSEGVSLQENAQRVHVAGNLIGTDITGAQKLGNRGNGVSIYQTLDSVIGGNSAVARNVISNNGQHGIGFAHGSARNVVLGNYIGTSLNGETAMGNRYFGVYIGLGANQNVIGGSTTGSGNVISGNENGILISDTGTVQNRVSGNYIGTNWNGSTAIPGQLVGVFIQNGSANNLIGGINSAGNLISGNGAGLWVLHSGTNGNRISGNKIGTDSSGTSAIPNDNGMYIGNGPSGTIVGSNRDGFDDAIEGNLISGNRQFGINAGNGVDNTQIVGNRIGTNESGNAALANGISGVTLTNSMGSVIIDNTISGNTSDGLYLADGVVNLRVTRNRIGTDGTGTFAIPNGQMGVHIRNGARDNIIGGTWAEGNVISGATSAGVYVADATTTRNRVSGNRIGVNLAGDTAVPNANFHGVMIDSYASGNIIGTDGNGVTDDQEGNVISGNVGHGIVIGSFTSNTSIAGNIVGLNAAGTSAIPNQAWAGITIIETSTGTLVGTNGDGVSDAYERNVISGSVGYGIAINGANVRLAGNYVGTDAAGNAAVPNAADGVYVRSLARNTIIGTNADGSPGDGVEGNVISGNLSGGLFTDPGSSALVIAGNLVGTNASGLAALGNRGNGMVISGTTDVQIGGPLTVQRNVSSGNRFVGIRISENSQRVQVLNNYVGTNKSGTAALGNGEQAVWLFNAHKQPNRFAGGWERPLRKYK